MIRNIQTGDFVNQGRDKVNEAFGEIPVGFDIDLENGDLVITKHNDERLRVPLANFYATLAKAAESFLPAAGSINKPGLLQLGDDSDADDLASESLVLPAAGVVRYVESVTENLPDYGTLVEGYIPFVRKKGDKLYLDFISPADMLTAQQAVICQLMAKCGNTGGGTTPTQPESSFTAVHFMFVDDTTTTTPPPTQQYDYVLGDGTYAGTFDMLNDKTYGTWAVKRGIGPANVDLKYKKRGSSGGLTNLGLNLAPNYDRQDVVDAPGINTPNGLRCGRIADVPDELRTGEEMEVRAFIAGTNIELKDSPRYINLALKVQPKTDVYRIVGQNVTEGGLGQQQVLEQQYTDNSWKAVAVEVWGLRTNISGITITGGVLKADADTVNGTTQIGVTAKPAGSATIVEDTRQIIEAGCIREGNLTTYTLTWNIAPVGGNASRFTSLDDANNQMGKYFDDTSRYNVAQFKVQVSNLVVGAKVYYRDDQTNCEVASDGTYYVTTSANGNTVRLAILVTGGLIVEIKVSTYTQSLPIPDTSWATLNDPFDASNPNYSQSNGTVWNWGNGSACVNVNNMVRGDTGALILDVDADRILCLITVGARDVTDPRYGVGLKYSKEIDPGNGGGFGGYNLLLTRQYNENRVQFLFDHMAYGPYYAYEWQPNTAYYVALRYTAIDANTARLDGKVWKVSEVEPANWPYTWDRPARNGLAAVVGGSNYPGDGNVAAGCVGQVWAKQVGVAPTLTDVARNKQVTAPYDIGLGPDWYPANTTDGNDLSLWTTGCLSIDTPVSLVVDLNGLARPQQVAITPRQDAPNAMPVDYTIDGSLDGQSWFTLISVTNQARGKAKTTLNIPQQNGEYRQLRYARLRSTKNDRAESGDCLRVQLASFEVLAPSLDALPANQKMSILQVARAFVGVNNARDLMYFVKLPADSTDQPTYGFNNVTTNFPNDLAGNHTIGKLAANNSDYPNTDWYAILNQARAQGFTHFIWATDGDAGQTMRFRFKGNSADTRYIDFDFVGPADGTVLNVQTIFPV